MTRTRPWRFETSYPEEAQSLNHLPPPLRVGKCLWKHPAKRIESVREDFESLSERAIPTLDIDDPKVLTRVFETARRLEITFYDASYLTATEESKAVLVTADKKLFGRLKGRKNAILLRDWKPALRRGRVSSKVENS